MVFSIRLRNATTCVMILSLDGERRQDCRFHWTKSEGKIATVCLGLLCGTRWLRLRWSSNVHLTPRPSIETDGHKTRHSDLSSIYLPALTNPSSPKRTRPSIMESDLPVRLRTTEQTAVVDPQPMREGASPDEGAGEAIEQYLLKRSEEFRKLFELCKEVSVSPE